jgi:hypothetical protein
LWVTYVYVINRFYCICLVCVSATTLFNTNWLNVMSLDQKKLLDNIEIQKERIDVYFFFTQNINGLYANFKARIEQICRERRTKLLTETRNKAVRIYQQYMDTYTHDPELVSDLEVLHQNGRAEAIACLMSLEMDSQEFHQQYHELEGVS